MAEKLYRVSYTFSMITPESRVETTKENMAHELSNMPFKDVIYHIYVTEEPTATEDDVNDYYARDIEEDNAYC